MEIHLFEKKKNPSVRWTEEYENEAGEGTTPWNSKPSVSRRAIEAKTRALFLPRT
jgi:hypothetical protein